MRKDTGDVYNRVEIEAVEDPKKGASRRRALETRKLGALKGESWKLGALQGGSRKLGALEGESWKLGASRLQAFATPSGEAIALPAKKHPSRPDRAPREGRKLGVEPFLKGEASPSHHRPGSRADGGTGREPRRRRRRRRRGGEGGGVARSRGVVGRNSASWHTGRWGRPVSGP